MNIFNISRNSDSISSKPVRKRMTLTEILHNIIIEHMEISARCAKKRLIKLCFKNMGLERCKGISIPVSFAIFVQFLHFRWGLVVSLFSFGFSGWFFHVFPGIFRTSDSKSAKERKSDRYGKMLRIAYLDSKIGVDASENERFEKCG